VGIPNRLSLPSLCANLPVPARATQEFEAYLELRQLRSYQQNFVSERAPCSASAACIRRSVEMFRDKSVGPSKRHHEKTIIHWEPDLSLKFITKRWDCRRGTQTLVKSRKGMS
jgi:hypothetical protein